MIREQIVQFAKKNGYDDVIYKGKWRQYDVYEPTIDGATPENPVYVGLPFIILVEGNKIRLSTKEEGFAYIYDLEDEIEEV